MSIKDAVPATHHDLLDAPGVTAFVTIDAQGRPQTTAIWYLVDEDGELKTTVLLTTQYLDEADQLADRIAVIDHGRVIAAGTRGELKTSVDSSRQKFKNASANPNISFFFVDPANPFHTLEIRGTAEIEKDTDDFAFLERLVKKYDATSDFILSTGRDRHVLTIKPWRVVTNG